MGSAWGAMAPSMRSNPLRNGDCSPFPPAADSGSSRSGRRRWGRCLAAAGYFRERDQWGTKRRAYGLPGAWNDAARRGGCARSRPMGSTPAAGTLPSPRLRHATRTELTIIRGYAQLALRRLASSSLDNEREIDGELRQALTAIEQASRALEAWIEFGDARPPVRRRLSPRVARVPHERAGVVRRAARRHPA